MHVHNGVSICSAPTYTQWKAHAYTEAIQQDMCWHFSLGPSAAHMHIDTNAYIWFTFSWCFHLQWLTMRAHTLADPDTKKDTHTHKTSGPRVGRLLSPSTLSSVSLCRTSEPACQRVLVCETKNYVSWECVCEQEAAVRRYTRIEHWHFLLFWVLSCYYLCDGQRHISHLLHTIC